MHSMQVHTETWKNGSFLKNAMNSSIQTAKIRESCIINIKGTKIMHGLHESIIWFCNANELSWIPDSFLFNVFSLSAKSDKNI